ncbi:hypothetical protein [Frateuria soli]|uniref:hypothetical protein n=1 Tax=Frateuria soli TaxID=1542730 RepID=UPI001E3DD004|nr:hypothetical protein [Frateuria soli]UGB37119.1 hypothetical protein LQ771_09750 [Frateuria soli]
MPALAGGISTRQFLAAMRDGNELGRYGYLLQAIPQMRGADRAMAQQYFAFSEGELGLYGEAVRDFPLKAHLAAGTALPTPAEWRATDAVDTIAGLAAQRRVVMVNEAHHDAHTRLLTLALLPRLRALGFTHLAIEALVEDGDALRQRGYPTDRSGTEYMREPVYGEIVREALRLGYVLVPYESDTPGGQEREAQQAHALYRKVLAGHPGAKLLVHAGYAHIDKARGRLGDVLPMAARLEALSGLDILSIDQTEVREEEPFNELEAYRAVTNAVRTGDSLRGVPQNSLTPRLDTRAALREPYHLLVEAFHPQHPIVLRHVGDGRVWSARPRAYDMNVILPPANERVSAYVRDRVIPLQIDGKATIALPPAADGHRPAWLSLHGRRVAVTVSPRLCEANFPCLVEAHYAGEPANAVAADRYVFLEGGSDNALWLRPGSYRLRSLNIAGKVLSERTVQVDATH